MNQEEHEHKTPQPLRDELSLHGGEPYGEAREPRHEQAEVGQEYDPAKKG